MSERGRSWPSGETLHDFLDGAPCGLLCTAEDGTILHVNETFLAWSGHERGALVGARRLDQLFTIPCRIYYETHYAPLLRLQGFVHEVAVDIVRQDGQILPAFVNTVEKRAPDGSVELVRVAIFAATDRRKYERELLLARRNSEDAVKAKADFLAMFAHEIRNPLNAVALQVQLLERRGLPPEHGTSVARLRTSLDKVLSLLNNMLDISKFDAGKVSVQESEFELANVVRAVVHTMGPLAERKGLPIEVRIDPDLPRRLYGDPVKLDQALTNLVGNAIKFTESGVVAIGASRVGSVGGGAVTVRFSVVDTGIGIPADRQTLIFDAYEQADASVERRFGGTGLGLAITRKLVELQGGRLSVTSEPGRGSTFAFELRLKAV
jgi:signal transduction histidine kinase